MKPIQYAILMVTLTTQIGVFKMWVDGNLPPGGLLVVGGIVLLLAFIAQMLSKQIYK